MSEDALSENEYSIRAYLILRAASPVFEDFSFVTLIGSCDG